MSFLLMGKDLLFVLLEGHKVEVQVLDSILLKQILSNQTVQVDACLGQSVVFIERRVPLYGTEVASVIAHVQ